MVKIQTNGSYFMLEKSSRRTMVLPTLEDGPVFCPIGPVAERITVMVTMIAAVKVTGKMMRATG
jgi:hypothetical protein